MICDICNKGEIKIKEIYLEEKKYLIEYCTYCPNCSIIPLHKNGISEFLIRG